MARIKGKESLREAVKRLDQPLWHQLKEVWRLASEGIHGAQQSRDGHQQGTAHCRAVEDNLSALIPDEEKGQRFSALDLFVLSAAAALHDVGKAGDSPDDHGHVSMLEIRDRAIEFGLDQGKAEVVGRIVRAHNDGNIQALPAGPSPIGHLEVDVRPLAAILKLADALHTDYRRVSPQISGFGGTSAEDNPKTRFRLRVRGWVFDDRGRILITAVPKDWDDVDVINTGFEMTRQELEPIVPTLKDAGFPWELDLYVDETDLEHDAILQEQVERQVASAFLGMDHYSEKDAPRFKGRDDDARALWRKVTANRVTLLLGESGVGKSSLIHAGLFPHLHRARWRTAVARPFEDPDRHVADDLRAAFPDGAPPAAASIVAAFERIDKAVGSVKTLIVLDQFEDVVRAPIPQRLDGLKSALVAVQARRFRSLRLLIAYRADAEGEIGPLLQEISGSDRGFSRFYLEPLSPSGARAALDASFAKAQIGIDDLLLDCIADDLAAQTPAAGVYPPYVQMVGETLCGLARNENEGILTEELFDSRGRAAGIIGRYLYDKLDEFGDRKEAARQVLVALARSAGVKAQQTVDVLQRESGLDYPQFSDLLDNLIGRRMMRTVRANEYEIIHDHLAQLVADSLDDGERRFKHLRELLDLRARSYSQSRILLQTPDMAELYKVRERISPNESEMRLLLHSCILGNGPAWFWLTDAPKGQIVAFLRDGLESQMPAVRSSAARYLSDIAGREAIPDLVPLLADQDWSVRQAVAKALAKIGGREAIPDLRPLLADHDKYVRRAAAETLANLADREAIPDLRRLLADQDEDEHVRQAAAFALADLAGREAIPDLRPLLADPDEDEDVRQAAALALTETAGWEDIADLRRWLADTNGEVRWAAVEALAKIAGQEDIPVLRRLLADLDGAVRRAAAQALAEIAGREDISDLRRLLADQNREVRRAAVEALAKIAGQEDIPNLRRLLADPDEDREVRRAAAFALANLAGQEDIPNLRRLLADPDATVRGAVALALAELAGREAIPDLRPLLADPDATVRGAAAWALANLADQEAIPNLLRLLADRNRLVQWQAAKALVKIAGRKAIPDLRRLLADQEVTARQAATETLLEIVNCDDLGWLAKLAATAHHAESGLVANDILIKLDHKLYFPSFSADSEETNAPCP